MLVEVVKPHGNAIGEKYAKEPGEKYECPDDLAKTLIDGELVKKAAKAKA